LLFLALAGGLLALFFEFALHGLLERLAFDLHPNLPCATLQVPCRSSAVRLPLAFLDAGFLPRFGPLRRLLPWRQPL
jgi:hypothetical protein